MRLAATISDLSKADVQRLPVQIPNFDGYEVLNILRVVDCVDERRSEYIKWTEGDHRADLAGEFRSVSRLFVDPVRIDRGAHIFRLARWLIGVVVSEPLMEAMKTVGCSGAVFSEV